MILDNCQRVSELPFIELLINMYKHNRKRRLLAIIMGLFTDFDFDNEVLVHKALFFISLLQLN